MDPSVANTCLDRNISSCNLSSQAVVHTSVSRVPPLAWNTLVFLPGFFLGSTRSLLQLLIASAVSGSQQ